MIFGKPEKYRLKKRILPEEELPDLVRGLLRPAAYRHKPESVKLIQTHVSYVLLAGPYVYKVKKPVDYGFLDFSTLDSRRFYLEEELRLNRQLCRKVYLGVVPIKKSGPTFRMGGRGETVEYALKMNRLPEERNLVSLLGKGRIDDGIISRIAEKIVRFHEKAERGEKIDHFGSPGIIARNVQENFRQIGPYAGRTIAAEHFEELRNYSFSFLKDRAGLFLDRIQAGKIRDCHGDLHCQHVFCGEKNICIFDRIEFNERFRYGDVASDLAFLTMDLDFRGYPLHSNRLLNDYLLFSGDYSLLDVFDFYQIYRACVRGKIESFETDGAAFSAAEKKKCRDEARRYFGLARQYLPGSAGKEVFMMHGLMGSGKSTLAGELAKAVRGVVVSSDAIRKRTAGFSALKPVRVGFGEGIYRPGWNERVYRDMLRQGEAAIRSGRPLFLDAAFGRKADRTRVFRWAEERKLKVFVIACRIPDDLAFRRLRRRQGGEREISDGREEIFARQKKVFEPFQPGEGRIGIPIEAGEDLPEKVKKVLNYLRGKQ